jgi:acyl-CoA synthetase
LGPTIQDAEERDHYIEQGWWGTEALSDVVARHATERPDAPAYRWGRAVLDWKGYHALGDTIAARLAGEGVRCEDRVLVFAPDGGGVHGAYLGCERAGAVAVGVGWRAGVRELRALVEKTRPRAAILPVETPLGPAAALCHELEIDRVLFLEQLDDAPRPRSGPVAEPAGVGDPSSLWLINSTSGTTGLPKCVMQTQNRWRFFHQLAVDFGELGRDAERFMSVVPAPFGFGLWTAHFTPTLLGAPCTVQQRFDAREAAVRIGEERISVLCAVSSQFVMILDAAEGLDLTSLRVLFTGGERLPLERSREFEARTGCTVLNFYGSNETGTLSGTRVGDPLEKRISTGGRCIDEMQVRLYDEKLKRISGDVGVGIPACRGPATSPGYFNDQDANRELFTEDGWMLMGDFVEIDDEGWLRVIGRSADFIVRGGKNISAPAVEEEVCTHPCVVQAAALPVPDRRLGETVGVCVQLRPGSELTLEGLCEHLASRGVSREWWPQHIAVLDDLPTSSGGKIAKGELRERVETLFSHSAD